MPTWQECIDKKLAVPTEANADRVIAYRNIALGRMDFVRVAQLNEKSASFVLEGYYLCILDFVRAISVAKGFLSGNSAIPSFIEAMLPEEKLSDRFKQVATLMKELKNGSPPSYANISSGVETALDIIENLNRVTKQEIDRVTQEKMESGKL